MFLAGREAERPHPGATGFMGGLVRAAERFVAETAEGTIIVLVLGAFIIVWMVFWTVSTAPLDVHIDADEALMWARHFAFGYKHPPLTGWVFGLWFAVFPRRSWAVDLLNVMMLAVALGVTWRLLRDHLDKNRALLGVLALVLIPLYDIKAEVLNANTITMPFWAAAVLFYLRARRGPGSLDAFLAGAFASLTLLGKYWAIFLFPGLAVASLIGPGTQRFWRSPAPYMMAAGAAIVLAPHLWWLVSERGGGSVQFAASVANQAPFSVALLRSVNYILGAIAYIAGPLIFLAALRPSRAALADIIWPFDGDRRQAAVLLAVPLLLPALVNLLVPYRLTPDWTFPNWALLPILLYGSRHLIINEAAVGRAIVFVVAATAAVLAATPLIAGVRLAHGPDQYRPHFRQVAELAEQLAGSPLRLYWGSESIVAGLPIYLPSAQRMTVDPLSAAGRAEAANGLVVICLTDDGPCRAISEALATAGARTTAAALTRSFLGFSSPPLNVQITVVPPRQTPAYTTD